MIGTETKLLTVAIDYSYLLHEISLDVPLVNLHTLD